MIRDQQIVINRKNTNFVFFFFFGIRKTANCVSAFRSIIILRHLIFTRWWCLDQIKFLNVMQRIDRQI